MGLDWQSLEDDAGDVIAKAQAGLGVGYRQLAEEIGEDPRNLRRLEPGETKPELWAKVAHRLGLNADALVALAAGVYHPQVKLPGTVRQLVQPFRDYTVNVWMVAPPGVAGGIIVDAGSRPDEILAATAAEKDSPAALFLTHLHPDHVGGLDGLRRRFPKMPIYAPELEAGSGMIPVIWGESLSVNGLAVDCRQTNGHTPGGTTYLFSVEGVRMAAVGDALFAASVGGCAQDYKQALEAIRKNILSLPDDTLLLPGHGPATTVGRERQHNPFFRECAPEKKPPPPSRGKFQLKPHQAISGGNTGQAKTERAADSPG